MLTAFSLLFRLIVGLASVVIVWFILDNIHDRNTEIIVACIGLMHCFVFVISRRLQYFGLSVFSIFGIALSKLTSEPFDHSVRDEMGLRPPAGYVLLTLTLVAIIEALCVLRLGCSLINFGWEPLFAPLRGILSVSRLLHMSGIAG